MQLNSLDYYDLDIVRQLPEDRDPRERYALWMSDAEYKRAVKTGKIKPWPDTV